MNRQRFGVSVRSLILWIPLAIVITALCGLIYLVVQQSIRASANDPQIQIAEDIANQLTLGDNPLAYTPSAKVDISKSLATYIMIFDDKGKALVSSAVIGNKTPTLPSGVLDSTKQKGETRFTWQPQSNARSAVVIDYYKNSKSSGYVLIGRSIREVEKREANQEMIVFVGWVITMLASLSFVYSLQRIKS